MARLFYAIPLPGEIRASIADCAASHLPERLFRLVPRENIHITIAFLGERNETEMHRASSLLDATGLSVAASGSPPGREALHLTLGTVGAFPKIRDPRVVWIGVIQGQEELTVTHGKLTAALTEAGIEFDRKPFRPHLTIAYRRRKKGASPQSRDERAAAAQALENLRSALSERQWSFPCPGVVLYESRLTGEGAIHRAL
ncbi:MAG: RNA 2',3'-cyclic phosphodiesterase [Spirochaetaceae bacterium]|nr:MAG: RNA 2',3'-cyclic phosphodiesterase [Spirochaetaceae bacterium]